MENNNYENCYIDSYRLSETAFMKSHNLTEPPVIFENKTLLQWGLFVAPRHPVFYKILENIVEVIKLEYTKQSIILPSLIETRFQVVVCGTGPRIMTATVREVFYDQELYKNTNYSIRIVDKDFKRYGGEYKVEGFVPYSRHHGNVYKHFTTYMKRHKVNLLKSYE